MLERTVLQVVMRMSNIQVEVATRKSVEEIMQSCSQTVGYMLQSAEARVANMVVTNLRTHDADLHLTLPDGLHTIVVM